MIRSISLVSAIVLLALTTVSCSDATVEEDRPGTERPTDRPVVRQTATTSPLPSDSATTDAFGLDQSIPLRVLTVSSDQSREMALVDFEEGTVTVYPKGLGAMASQPRGATISALGDVVTWNYDPTVHVYDAGTPEPVLEVRPTRDPWQTGAPSLRVVPTPAGDRLWVVQPGSAVAGQSIATRIDLIDIATGISVASFEADPSAMPAGAITSGLVLNVDELFDTGDGWATRPGSERVRLADASGSLSELGPGRAIGAAASSVIRLVCHEFDRNCDLHLGEASNEEPRPTDGTWMDIGNVRFPSETTPFNLLSPNGSKLIIGFGEDLDVNGKPARSSLFLIDVATGTRRSLAEFTGVPPIPAWSQDGRWVATIEGTNVTFYDADKPGVVFTVANALPEGHLPLAAG